MKRRRTIEGQNKTPADLKVLLAQEEMKSEEISERTKEAMDFLVTALESGHSAVLTQYLAAMAKFRNYSFSAQCCLIQGFARSGSFAAPSISACGLPPPERSIWSYNRSMERKIFWLTFILLGLLADFLLPFWYAFAATLPIIFIAWWVAYRSDWF